MNAPMGTDATSGRTVEPFGLFFLNLHWYLAGRIPGDETVKNYRLNRITDAQKNTSKQAFFSCGYVLNVHACGKKIRLLRVRVTPPIMSRPVES